MILNPLRLWPHPLPRPIPRGLVSSLTLVLLQLITGCADRGSSLEPADKVAASTPPTAEPGTRPTQVAARVNGEELTVHQINDRLVAWGINADPAGGEDAAQGQTLKRLIDLTLLRQEAEAQGLSQSPNVLRQLQAARAEVLARAWAQQLGDDEPAPTAAEVRRHYDEHPEAFARRQVFHIQELQASGSADDLAPVMRRLPEHRQASSLARALDQAGHRSRVGTLMVASDQLTPQQRQRLQALAQGQGLTVENGPELRVWWVQATIDQPIDWPQAQSLIERLLQSQARAERVRQELQRLKDQARIEYLGDFARWSPPNASPTAGSAESPQGAATPSAAR